MNSKFLVSGEEPLLAWSHLKGVKTQAASVSLLKPKGWNKARPLWTFKIDHLPNINGSVIAIKTQMERLVWEAHLYSTLLPRLQIEAPYCYGISEEPSQGLGWLFIECVDTSAFDKKNSVHQTALASWLGKLHHATAMLNGRDFRGNPMPQINSGFFEMILKEALQLFAKFNDANLPLHSRKGENMFFIEAKLSLIQRHWHAIEKILLESPVCLIHYDLKTANIGLCPNSAAPIVKPFDWEYSGWGPIACDLGATGVYEMDISSYICQIQARWPKISEDEIVMYGKLGCLLRAIHTTLWRLQTLDGDFKNTIDLVFKDRIGSKGNVLDLINDLI